MAILRSVARGRACICRCLLLEAASLALGGHPSWVWACSTLGLFGLAQPLILFRQYGLIYCHYARPGLYEKCDAASWLGAILLASILMGQRARPGAAYRQSLSMAC